MSACVDAGPWAIRYVTDDATRPKARENEHVILPHVCNAVGGWGKGFVGPLGRRYPLAQASYRAWYAGRLHNAPPFRLGAVLMVPVAPRLTIAHMIAQTFIKRGRIALIPLSYLALMECLETVAKHAANDGATLHMPRIGTGLAGGTWSEVSRTIENACARHNVPVTVYTLTGDERPLGG